MVTENSKTAKNTDEAELAKLEVLETCPRVLLGQFRGYLDRFRTTYEYTVSFDTGLVTENPRLHFLRPKNIENLEFLQTPTIELLETAK